jgi:hypothetical protein
VVVIFLRLSRSEGRLFDPEASRLPAQETSSNAASPKNTPKKSTLSRQSYQALDISPERKIDAIKSENVAEWTNALPSLRRLSHSAFEDAWVLEQDEPAKCPSFDLRGTNETTVQFSAKFVDVQVVNERVRRVEMRGQNMDIAELREFGNSLLKMLGKDQVAFNAWCDKVGNKWLDAPDYNSGSSHMPSNNKFFGFEVLTTYRDEKPWCVYFTITDP